MGSKKNFIEKKICKVIELGKLYTSMIFFPKNLNSFIGEYAKNRAKRVNKILSFPAAPSLNTGGRCISNYWQKRVICVPGYLLSYYLLFFAFINCWMARDGTCCFTLHVDAYAA